MTRTLILFFALLLPVANFAQIKFQEKDSLFLYKVTITKKYKELKNWNSQTTAILQKHTAFIDSLGPAGVLVFGSRTLHTPNDDRLIGLACIKAKNQKEAEDIMAKDPGVVNGIQQAELAPYSIGLPHFYNFNTDLYYPETDSSSFDFWLGTWELTWSDTVKGTNTITKDLGGYVVFENFHDPSSSYDGKSWSVFNKQKQVWEQTWVDNGGNYMTFKGGKVGENMELQMMKQTKKGNWELYKMVFFNITKSSFDWEWKKSSDSGLTWTSLWLIHYKRK